MNMNGQVAPRATIRALARGDLDAVVAIDAAIERRSRRTYFERRLVAALREPTLNAQFAAIDGKGLAGYILARVLEGEFGRSGSGLRLEVVGVRKDCQGMGVGTNLFETLVGWARRHAINGVYTQAAWTDHSMLYDFKGRPANGEPIEYRVGIFGTSIFYQSSTFNGRWFGFIAPMGLPRPGQSKVFLIIAARKSDGDAASTTAFIDFAMDLEKRVVSEDVPILQSIHFKPGTLTKSDKALGKFLQYLRSYPRAHPSAEFIS